jgi:CubicO group peptidase (beta-lactamase class C family)
MGLRDRAGRRRLGRTAAVIVNPGAHFTEPAMSFSPEPVTFSPPAHEGGFDFRRRPRRRYALSSFAAALAVYIAAAAPLHAQDAALLARTDSIFAHMDTPTTPGCALSVMQGGALVYERGYGMANLEYDIPITPLSVFHVASVSKHFTAMAIELLVNEGRVSWDDDIRTYVPEVPDFGERITLRHLVHHVSGIRDQWNLLGMAGWRWEADLVTQKDVLDITSRQTSLNFRPGERHLYSNTGYTLLAVVVERVSGQTLRQFTDERIFRPLGMTRTHFHDDHQHIVPGRAYAYAPDEHGPYGLRQSIPDFAVVGATSLFTTARDLAAWDGNFYSGRVGGREAVVRLEERFVLNGGDTISYAHGLVHGTHRGLRTLSHGGADAGYRSFFVRFPDQQWSAAVLCNFPASNPGSLALRTADIWLGDAIVATAPAAVPANPDARSAMIPRSTLENLAGLYRSVNGFEVQRIRLDNDTLRVEGPGLSLRPLADDRFEVLGPGLILELRPPRAGEPAALIIPAEGGDVYLKVPDWSPSSADLRSFAGTYHSAELGTDYRFIIDDEGRLAFRHRKLADGVLQPMYENAFMLRGRILVFERDGDGRVTGFRLNDGRVQGVAFTRIE